MKINYKKIATVLGSVLMVGSTMGLAAAANFPQPFSSGDVAIVTGSMGADAMDLSSATTIAGGISNSAALGAITGTITGGDSFKLEKSSDKFYFNEALNSSYASLDADELEIGLAAGVYDSGDVEDVDYKQSITLGSNVLSLFTNSNYQNKEPTVGFKFANADNVLSYAIDFDDNEANLTEMPETDMPFLGKEYYVLTATNTKIELLDSADTVIVSDGTPVTVNGKVVSINWIDGTDVILNVDGVNVKKLREGGIAQLPDDSYVAIKNVLSSDRTSTTQKVEFSIGSGKIILENGKEVIVGEDSDDKVRGLWATITNDTAYLDTITLTWNSKDTTFLTPTSPLTMPGLGVISLAYNGLSYASSSEAISLEGGSETLTLDMGNFDIPLMWYSGTAYAQGEEGYPLKIATARVNYSEAGYDNASTMFWEDGVKVNTSAITTGLTLTEDDKFVVTVIDNDLSDVKTFYGQVTDIDVDDGDWTVDIDDMIGDSDLKFEGTDITETEESNDITFKIDGFKSDNETIYLSVTTASALYNTVVSEKGLVVTIPAVTSASENGGTIVFREADKDEDVNEGVMFNATISNSTNDKLSVTLAAQTNASKEETLTDNKYTALVKSELATKIATDETGDEYDLEIEYFGKEAIADVKVAIGATVGSSTGGSTAIRPILDTDTTAMAGKNLIVVGGSCVNKVAAQLLELGNPTSVSSCLAAFTTKTNVAAGQFVIQAFNANLAGGTAGKVALLVAGYEREDTQKASTYLTTKQVDTTAGKKYIGTSTTEARLV